MPHGQTLTVLSGSHSLKDHKHVAMAVSKSIRADSRHEISKRTGQYVAKNKPYIASAILYQVRVYLLILPFETPCDWKATDEENKTKKMAYVYVYRSSRTVRTFWRPVS